MGPPRSGEIPDLVTTPLQGLGTHADAYVTQKRQLSDRPQLIHSKYLCRLRKTKERASQRNIFKHIPTHLPLPLRHRIGSHVSYDILGKMSHFGVVIANAWIIQGLQFVGGLLPRREGPDIC